MKNLFSLKSGSDVRGRAAGENAAVTPEVVALIGGAFVRWLKARGVASPRIALGRDSRVTGEALLTACAAGCARAGAAVESYDMCTTPAMYMSLITPGFSCDGAIMMTASHHPWDRNGMKFFTKAGGVEAAGEKVTDIGRSFTEQELREGVLLKRGKKNFAKVVLK